MRHAMLRYHDTSLMLIRRCHVTLLDCRRRVTLDVAMMPPADCRHASFDDEYDIIRMAENNIEYARYACFRHCRFFSRRHFLLFDEPLRYYLLPPRYVSPYAASA